jgi:hypothetical protein
MRTTVNIHDSLLDAVRREAAENHRSIGATINEALRQVFAAQTKGLVRQKTCLPAFKGNGVQSGVDLDSSVSLLDRMEGL